MLYATGVTPRCCKPKPQADAARPDTEPGAGTESQGPGAEHTPGQQQPRNSSCCQEAKRLKACHAVRKKAKIFWENAKKARGCLKIKRLCIGATSFKMYM